MHAPVCKSHPLPLRARHCNYVCPLKFFLHILSFLAVSERTCTWCTRAAMGMALRFCFSRSVSPPLFCFLRPMDEPNFSRPSRPARTLSNRSALSCRRFFRPVGGGNITH